MDSKIKWLDFQTIGVEGQGWNDFEFPYDRIPSHAKNLITERIWNLSHSSTGLSITFITDSPEIHVRRTFEDVQLGEHNFNVCAFSGFDLYAEDKGQWRWVQATSFEDSLKEEYRLAGNLCVKRKYRIYLPLRNRLLSAELGIVAGYSIEYVSPHREKPVVFYGSSIVHGAYVSHAGLSHPSLLGRWLNTSIINLGFSGAARMELAMAELLCELDPAVYVIDALPNMTYEMVKDRAWMFIKTIRKKRPHTPLLIMEDAPRTNAWIFQSKMAETKARWKNMRQIYRKLCLDGGKNIAYLKGNTLFGTDGEVSVDGVHPGDIGVMSMSRKIYPVLKKILEQ